MRWKTSAAKWRRVMDEFHGGRRTRELFQLSDKCVKPYVCVSLNSNSNLTVREAEGCSQWNTHAPVPFQISLPFSWQLHTLTHFPFLCQIFSFPSFFLPLLLHPSLPPSLPSPSQKENKNRFLFLSIIIVVAYSWAFFLFIFWLRERRCRPQPGAATRVKRCRNHLQNSIFTTHTHTQTKRNPAIKKIKEKKEKK